MNTPHVLTETVVRHKLSGAGGASERLLASVQPLVALQRLLRLEVLVAEAALELGVLVNQLVRLAGAGVAEALPAVLADVPLVGRVREDPGWQFSRLGPILGPVFGPLMDRIFRPLFGMPLYREFCSIVQTKVTRL